MDSSRLPWICQRLQLRAGCHQGGSPKAAAGSRVAQGCSGRRCRSLSCTHIVVPSKGALALSFKEPSPHCNLAGLYYPFNLCQPPPPPPALQSFQDWINKIHPRVARNTSCEGIWCSCPCWPGNHPQTNSDSLAFSHLLTSLSQNTHYFLRSPCGNPILCVPGYLLCEYLHPPHKPPRHHGRPTCSGPCPAQARL